jgi:hypothetical protein
MSSTVHFHIVPGQNHLDALSAGRVTRHRSHRSCGSRTVADSWRKTGCGDPLLPCSARTLRPQTSVCGVIRAGLAHSTWPRSTPSRSMPRISAPILSPAWPWSSSLRNISTPVQVVLVRVADPNDFDFFADFQNAGLNAAGDNGPASRNREDIFHGHQERACQEHAQGSGI